MQDHIGEAFDRYQIEAFIRQGVWGGVYRAYDPKFARRIALQILSPELASQEKMVQDYLQLARTILRWRHPGIIRFFDFGESHGTVFTIQEYIKGMDLEQVLDKMRANKQWIPLSEAVQLVLAVCQALDYAHQRGVKHLNLGPNNILLNAEPGAEAPFQPVLINLGFGLINQAAANGDANQDVLQDIRAAGRLLFLLICASELGMDIDNIPNDAAEAEIYARIRKYRPDLPHSLERVIFQALTAGSQSGYQNVLDLGASLKQAVPVAQRISSAPAGFESVLSLAALTHNANKVQGTEPQRLASENKLATDKESPTRQDTLHILLPDQSIRSIPFRGQQMTIGRGAENDIVLDETGVSRQHARIEFDGKQYQVTDLKSTNGVFIDEFRLLAETPHPWLPGENLRIGEVWLRIEKAEQELNTVAIPSVQPTRKIVTEPAAPVAPVEEIQEKPRLSANPISAFTLETNLMVTPGKSASAPVVLYNRSTKADVYYLELNGIPNEWTVNRPQSISVPANGQKEISLVFRPPRTFTSRAGRHAMILRITSQNDPAQVLELRLALTISAFTQFSSEIQPKQLKSGDNGALVLRNLGNIPETFTISWEDQQGELAFDPKRANATVPAGESVRVPYQVSRAQALWFGGEKVNSYKVNISSQSAQAQSHTGSFFSKALIPPWAVIALITLCLILSCVLIVFSNQLLGNGPNLRATERATQTMGAMVNQQTAEASTATALAIVSGNQATLQAATATAAWLQGDDDGDGLTNGQEILLNTRPDLKDTDGDGLSDFDEVNTYRTDPLNPDTDGDGLKDGEEVQRGTDPLRRDTDGDGIDDGLDPDPLNASTSTQAATSTLTITPTASLTASLTPTPTYPPNIANLSLTLTNNTTSSIPGTNTAYTLQVHNSSPNTVSNAQVINTPPSILQNVTWNCVASAGSACQTANGFGNIDTRINLAPAGTINFTISATILPSASGLLINSASVVLPAGMSDPDTSDNQAMDTDNLTPAVSLTISKTDNRTAIEAGETLTYAVVVGNNGPSAVIGLTVTDYFSDALTNISWECIASSGSSCAVSGVKTGNISTEVNLNPAGSATFSIQARVKNSASGVLTNTASLISPINPAVNNKTATDTTNIVPKADLAVSVSAPLSATTSTQVTLTITVTNQGPSNVTGLTLVDGLPTGATYLSSDPGEPVCTILGNTLTCALGDLASGEKKVVKLVIRTPALPGTITNLVNVTANQADPDMTNNQASTEILIN